MKKILIVLGALPLIVWAVWMAFPVSSIQSIIENSMNEKFTLEIQDLKKGLFYSVNIDTLLLRKKNRELIIGRDIRCRVSPPALLKMRLDASIDGHIGTGGISGTIRFSKNGAGVNLDFTRADLGEIPLFKALGLQVEGTISGRLIAADEKGHVEFFTENAHFAPAQFSGVVVPLNFFNAARGSFDITGNVIQVLSLSLEGKDIHARLKGVINDAYMDLRMELMPEKAFLGNPFFVSELEKYMVSPGYYVIPVKGNLSL